MQVRQSIYHHNYELVENEKNPPLWCYWQNLNNQRQCELLFSDHLVMSLDNGFIVKMNFMVISMFVLLIQHNTQSIIILYIWQQPWSEDTQSSDLLLSVIVEWMNPCQSIRCSKSLREKLY